jgi:hypothetical protein
MVRKRIPPLLEAVLEIDITVLKIVSIVVS